MCERLVLRPLLSLIIIIAAPLSDITTVPFCDVLVTVLVIPLDSLPELDDRFEFPYKNRVLPSDPKSDPYVELK